MNTIIRLGNDLDKHSFAVCGVDENEKIVLQKTLRRSEMRVFFAHRPPAVVAMEAGSGAHHWARELGKLADDARIIDPRLLAPYRHQRRSGKNDTNEAAVIRDFMVTSYQRSSSLFSTRLAPNALGPSKSRRQN